MNEAILQFASGGWLTPVPSMPSLPPRDGVDARLCADIHVGALTISAIDRLTHVVGTSLPLPPIGEHDSISSPSGTFPLGTLCPS